MAALSPGRIAAALQPGRSPVAGCDPAATALRHPETDLNLRPTRPVERVGLRTGVTLECVDQGDRDGVPVVFLHGITDSWRSFEPVLPHLPGWLRAIAVSQRGHGGSGRPAGYRPGDFAADVAALTDPIDRSVAVEFQLSTLARPVPADFLDMVVGESLKVAARVWRDGFDGLLADDHTDRLPTEVTGFVEALQ